jgi:hypothetical protein
MRFTSLHHCLSEVPTVAEVANTGSHDERCSKCGESHLLVWHFPELPCRPQVHELSLPTVSTPGHQATYRELDTKNSFQQIQEPCGGIRKTFLSRADASYMNMKWFTFSNQFKMFS